MTAKAVADRLPPSSELERISLAIAALDVVLLDDPFDRMFSFEPSWRTGLRLASMTNGAGGEYRIIFADDYAVIRAFDHESDLSPWNLPEGELATGILEGCPAALQQVVLDSEFRVEGGPPAELTFCAWAADSVAEWTVGTPSNDGGGAWLLEVVLGDSAKSYQEFVEEFLERPVERTQLQHFFDLAPVTESLVTSMSPEADFAEVRSTLQSIGYPER